MKNHALALLLLTATPALGSDPKAWVRDPPSTPVREAKIQQNVSQKNIFEVPVSEFSDAEQRLLEKPIVRVRDDELASITSDHFSCSYPEMGFLVRAVYENAVSGRYRVQRFDSSIWIVYSSLGPASGVHRSALFVCLDFEPDDVFVSTDGAL